MVMDVTDRERNGELDSTCGRMYSWTWRHLDPRRSVTFALFGWRMAAGPTQRWPLLGSGRILCRRLARALRADAGSCGAVTGGSKGTLRTTT